MRCPRTKITPGMVFGRLTTINRFQSPKNGRICWNCLCSCGKTISVITNNLTSKSTKSCGCFRRDNAKLKETTHGMSRSSEYEIWRNMIDRCENSNNKNYFRYGGRGITVCERWKSFPLFIQDLGLRPTKGHSLDRINNDGGYEPTNCRWATWTQQNRNKRLTIKLKWEGSVTSLPDLAEKYHLPISRLRRRVKAGWDLKEAVLTPPQLNQWGRANVVPQLAR